jgi:hypothetical protein
MIWQSSMGTKEILVNKYDAMDYYCVSYYCALCFFLQCFVVGCSLSCCCSYGRDIMFVLGLLFSLR